MSLTDDKLRKGLANVEKSLAQTGRSMQRFGAGAMAFGGAVVAGFMPAIKAASDAQETMSKFSIVFGDLEQDALKWTDALAESIGRSKHDLRGQMAAFQDLFQPMGFAAEDAFELSKTMTALASDLGSFNNLDTADVIRDLQAAMTGSGEVMKKYGVILSEAAVKAKLEEMGLESNEVNKVLARQAIIMEDTVAAQGDAARTADSFANQLARLRAAVLDASVAVGEKLLPIVTPLVEKAGKVVQAVAEWASQNETLVVGILATGGLVLAIGAISTAIGILTTALTTLMAHPFIIGLAGLTVAVWGLYEAFKALSATLDETIRKSIQFESTREMEAYQKDPNAAPNTFRSMGQGYMGGGYHRSTSAVTSPQIPMGGGPPVSPMDMDELIDVNEQQLAKQDALLRWMQNNQGLVFG
jgi:hypothetical protein